MPVLWLTYAWRDNEENEVDFVISELRRAGLTVAFDRAVLVPGQRIWPNLDRAISNPATCDAWAIYVTQHSLESEPCREELAIALDRALARRGDQFPLIGIFPQAIDRGLIPGTLRTRLYVNLEHPNWAAQVAAGVAGVPPQVELGELKPFHLAVHRWREKFVIEVRPRAGRWGPFVVTVPTQEAGLIEHITPGLPGEVTGNGNAHDYGEVLRADGNHVGLRFSDTINALTSAFIYLSAMPSEIDFGDLRGQVHLVRF
jgi:hypothetical protein